MNTQAYTYEYIRTHTNVSTYMNSMLTHTWTRMVTYTIMHTHTHTHAHTHTQRQSCVSSAGFKGHCFWTLSQFLSPQIHTTSPFLPACVSFVRNKFEGTRKRTPFQMKYLHKINFILDQEGVLFGASTQRPKLYLTFIITQVVAVPLARWLGYDLTI